MLYATYPQMVQEKCTYEREKANNAHEIKLQLVNLSKTCKKKFKPVCITVKLQNTKYQIKT